MEIFFEDPEASPAAAARLADAGRILGIELEVKTRSFPDEDWMYAYRKYFHNEQVTPRICVHPPWEPVPDAPVVVTIDPGMAFGTGRHETTHACLEFIDSLSGAPGADRSFLDMGTGSGILAFAAAKLGFGPVRAFDIDADAVRIARENAEANGVDVELYVSDLSKKHERARFVVANILGPVLVHFSAGIAGALADGPDSRLVLSGILDRDYPAVRAAFEGEGLKELDSIVRGEWRTGLFARA